MLVTRRVMSVALLAGSLTVVACKGQEKPTPPAESPATEIALAGAVVMIGAGDIAMCGVTGDEQTASIVDSVLKADSIANVANVVITMGDNAYPAGTVDEFARCFGASWGSP